MKRSITMVVLFVGLFALVALPVSAGEACGAKAKTIDAKQASAKSETGFCSKTAAKECSSVLGISEEECVKLCEDGSIKLINMSVKGMTCGGCENKVTTQLTKVPGVLKVSNVSHKDGIASFYLDTRKGKTDAAVAVVAANGYAVEVIPAVATTATAVNATGAKGCDPVACAKSCDTKDKAACDAHKAGEKSKAKSSDGASK